MKKSALKKAAGFSVFVRDGVVLWGIHPDDANRIVYPFRRSGSNRWLRDDNITVQAFRAGIRSGKIAMF